MKPNRTASHNLRHRYARWVAPSSMLALCLLAGCASMLPPPPPAANVYLLEAWPKPTGAARQSGKVIEVSMPRARAGFDTAQMVWMDQAHELKVYSRNRWADTPARMLAPLLAQTLAQSGAFQAVVQTPSTVSSNLRLDTELVRLQQDFSVKPSRIQLTLGVQLVDTGSRQVIASAEFDESENAPSEDAYGGVRAANLALDRLLARLSAFCAQQAP
jgi:cholesterol transport system auxiliary component